VRQPLANARGSETPLPSRDREGAVKELEPQMNADEHRLKMTRLSALIGVHQRPELNFLRLR
jgi:hypothetical protein